MSIQIDLRLRPTQVHHFHDLGDFFLRNANVVMQKKLIIPD